ncbi:MAG: AMIN domain-containing protein, partial [Desulfobacteraceae bacterium]
SMANKSSLHQRGVFFLLTFFTSGALLLGACATPSSQQVSSEVSEAPVIESLQVQPSPEQTVVEIQNSRPTHYTAFTLIDPPRVILDIRGEVGPDLRQTTEVNDENVREIRFEKGKTQTMTTRVVVALARAVDYEAVEQENRIRLILTPKGTPPGTAQLSEGRTGKGPQETAEAGVITPAEPRIFFKPRPIGLNQVLGVDFTMLDAGRSLLVVTTDKKVPYQLERSGPKTLLLTLEKSTIPPLLMRRLDSRYFEGTVDRVKATPTDSQVALAISLREMVPFHVKQTESAISIDFGPTAIEPPEKRLMPLKVSEAKAVQVVRAPAEGAPEMAPRVARVQPPPTRAEAFGPPTVGETIAPVTGRQYRGEPMYLDFVNAEVTNILRLVNEVSDENIIWDPAIAGKKVSMVLKNVPWDQALDLILVNNDLDKRRYPPNIIWITTKEKMMKIEAEERKRQQEAEARIEADRKRKLEEQEKKKQLEPLITEFIPLDFANADEIKQHIVLSDRGTISTDARTNTIIIKDISENIEEAKKTVKQFDTPVKQIMIEARIVDASTNFTQELGVRWGIPGTAPGVNAQRRSNTGVTFGIPTDATSYTTGMDSLRGGTFSSNAPTDWTPNLGFSIGYLTSSTLGAITINAEIALAETEGKAKIISAPKVIASNGESATIARGSTFYLEAAENVEPKEVTAQLSLEVTPTVSYNNFVTMEVTVKDEQEQFRGKTGKDLSTKLMIKSGETIVIGGIYTETSAEDESGIPYLRSVPFLGWLFKAKLETRDRTELLIFLTPTVVSTGGDAKASL